jgi:hypothetical protein
VAMGWRDLCGPASRAAGTGIDPASKQQRLVVRIVDTRWRGLGIVDRRYRSRWRARTAQPRTVAGRRRGRASSRQRDFIEFAIRRRLASGCDDFFHRLPQSLEFPARGGGGALASGGVAHLRHQRQRGHISFVRGDKSAGSGAPSHPATLLDPAVMLQQRKLLVCRDISRLPTQRHSTLSCSKS